MQFSTPLLCFLGVMLNFARAQDSDSCDPQNDSNNDATCTGNNGATSTLGSRISVISDTVTSTYTPVATGTDTILMTTSLPHSLDTLTNTILSTSVFSSESVFTTNTLTDSNGVTTGTASATATPSNAAVGKLNNIPGAMGAVLLVGAALL